MIKTIIFVEDGSVDVEELRESLGAETKVVVYRQGAAIPRIEQPSTPIADFIDDRLEEFHKQNIAIRDAFIEILTDCRITKKVRGILETLYSEYYDD